MHFFPRLHMFRPFTPAIRLGQNGIRRLRTASMHATDIVLDHAGLSAAIAVMLSAAVRLGPGNGSAGRDLVSFTLILAAPIALVLGTLRLNRPNRP